MVDARMSHRLWFVGEVDVEAMVLFHRVTVAAVFRRLLPGVESDAGYPHRGGVVTSAANRWVL
jgi:hypothetical protein